MMSPLLFCATGVTDGPLLDGVRHLASGRTRTHSVVMRSATGTVRTVVAEHVSAVKFPGLFDEQ